MFVFIKMIYVILKKTTSGRDWVNRSTIYWNSIIDAIEKIPSTNVYPSVYATMGCTFQWGDGFGHT